MRTVEQRKANAAYKRLWGARQRLALLEARYRDKEIDLHSGMTRAEVLRIAQIDKMVKEASYRLASGAAAFEVEECYGIAHGEISFEIGAYVDGKRTVTFFDELQDLDSELQLVRLGLAAALPHSPVVTPNSQIPVNTVPTTG